MLFQIPSLRTVHGAPKRRYIDDVIFGLQENLSISETVYDRSEISTEHNLETIVGLSGYISTNCVQRSLADIAPWRHFRFARTRHYLLNGGPHDENKVTIEHLYETLIALSSCFVENCTQRPLAEIYLWRQFRFVRKPHNLGNGLR